MSTFDLPIAGPSKNVAQDDPEATFNLYPEAVAEGVFTLKPTPGTIASTALSGLGGGRSKGLSVGGRLFGIRGAFFCEDVGGTSVIRGTLNTTQGLCAMTSCLPPNGDGQVLIVGPESGEAYVFELATNTFTTLSEGTHGFVGGGGQTIFLGGRAYAIKKGTGQFQASSLYNFLSWPGDAFGTAEFDSDELVAIDTDGNYLLLFGSKTLEVWALTNSLPLPVNPTSNTSNIGILAPQAHCVYNNTFYWLGGDVDGNGVFYSMTGTGVPKPFSDYSISRNVQPLEDKEDAVMYSYQSLGHPFILTTFFSGNKTFVFDVSNGLWHMRGQRAVPSGQEFALPWIGMTVHDGQLLGMSKKGRFYQIRDDVFTDDGNPIVRRRVLPVFPKEGSWKTVYSSVELFGEMGNAPLTSDSTYTNVVAGSAIATNPVIVSEIARYIHIGYYVGSDIWVAFAFSSSAARQSYLAGNPPYEGFLGFAMGSYSTEPQNVTIVDLASNELLSFTLNPITQDDLPVSFDILRKIIQPTDVRSVSLTVSRDRGKTYGTEMWRNMSGNGSYVCRGRWTGLGAAFGIVLKFETVANSYISWRSVRVEAE